MRAHHRLLFISQPRTASLVPIYVAILLLGVFGVLELCVALWLASPATPSESRPQAQQDAPASRPFDGGLRVPAEPRKAEARTTRM